MRDLFILFLLFISNSSFSQGTTIEEALKDHFTRLNSIECKYQQEKHLSILNEPLISTGIFKYEKEGNIRWEQQTPFREVYLINRESENVLDKYVQQFILSILKGSILNDKRFEVIYSENEKSYIALVIPVKGSVKHKINQIKLTFNQEVIALIQLEIISKNGDLSRINFYDN